MLSFSASTDLFLLRQLQHLHTLLEITRILCILLDPYAHMISFHSITNFIKEFGGVRWACYTIEIVMTYGVVWIIFLNISLLYMIFYVKQMAHVNASNLLWVSI